MWDYRDFVPQLLGSPFCSLFKVPHRSTNMTAPNLFHKLRILGCTFSCIRLSMAPNLFHKLTIVQIQLRLSMAALISNQAESSSSSFPSSSSTPQWNYDVFLSFRGIDTRKTFTGHLYKALIQAGLRTFIDEELPRGTEIKPELRKAIRESRTSIVVFSKNYASSRWCLDELLEILECKKITGQLVLPVFYDVDPSDVRNQNNSFADAFASHDARYVSEMEKTRVEMWRAALAEAASLSGYHLETDPEANGHEARLIEKIIGKVVLQVDPKTLNMCENSRVDEIISLLGSDLKDVLVIGIYGLGGIEKTTVAKAVLNKILHKF